VDRTSVEAFCQLYDVFVDEKRRLIEDEGGSSRVSESHGKTKGPAFKVKSKIE
jgi:phage terminase small subunit